jgi:hypothetical protein
MQQHQHVDETVKQLLDQAQGAIHASNANQALQVLSLPVVYQLTAV